MAVNVDDLTVILADRLAGIVPPGFGVQADDADAIVRVAVLALDHLQDYVSEATHDPWPGTSSQPRPCAQIRGQVLHLWYGEPDNVVLACRPIPLAGILSPR
jgi:hypothetical protein